METDNEPIHPNLNMDYQPRYNTQETNELFDDGMAMRPPVPGTVAKGFLREDVRFYSGQTEEGRFVEKVPVPVTRALLERGRERYNIFCSVCHGQAGFGQGVIMTGDYGYAPAPTYHKSALRDTADGYLYDVITNGVRNMPGYAAQVPVADRWAIVAYIRALQRSQNAQRENVPPSVLARIEQTGSANMNAARNPAGPTGGGAGSGSGSGSASSSGDASDEDSAPASEETSPDTAATGPTAEAQTPDATAPSDTAADAGTDTTTDAVTGRGAAADAAGMDTTMQDADAEGAAVAENTAGPDTTARSVEDATMFGSTFFVLLLVALPIVVLMGILVVAFRKDRDH
jgi:mono/diheme cytochrome c family protein